MVNEKKPIILYENTDQLMNASIDKMIVELISKRDGQRSSQAILMTGCSPLAGTTSVSISLAIAMAATSRKTVLVDCDVRKSADYKKLNDEARIGLANYLSANSNSEKKLDEIVYDTNIESLKYVPCGDSDENPTRILCSNRMNGLLRELRDSFDCVILDCPSFSVVPDAEILFGKVDGIIFVSALGETKKSHISDARRIIAPYFEHYYGMIINKASMDIYKSNVKEYGYYLLDKKGKQRFEKNKIYKKMRKTKAIETRDPEEITQQTLFTDEEAKEGEQNE